MKRENELRTSAASSPREERRPRREQGFLQRLRFGFSVSLLLLLGTIARSQSRSTVEPELRDDGTLRFTAQGEFRSSKAAAEESVRQVAQEQMRAWFAKQTPPIRRTPSLDAIRREKMILNEKTEVETVLNEKMYKITAVIELKPSQLRELRKRDRSLGTLWMFSVLLVFLGLVSFGFRVDEWTKGYLTRWLIGGGIALAVIALGFITILALRSM